MENIMGMREVNPVGFRPWPNLWDLIRKVAKQNSRSINSQVNHYLAQGLRIEGYEISNPDQDSKEEIS